MQWAESNLHCKNVFYLNNFASFVSEKQTTRLNGIEGKRIVHLAGFRAQKDHMILLKAFKEVVKIHPDWTLHLVGKNYQDDYGKSILQFIDENNLNTSIFLYGVCSDIKYILSQATMGVLSSRSEGLPISLLEYGLAKLPVLVTNVGQCKEVVINEEAISTPNSYKDLKEKMISLIASETLRTKIKNELHSNVIENYSAKSFIFNLQKIYSF